eukprot:TRINITY_DN7684_c0_g1_i1.p1 TRINITY_DN7684_c0_g1~~TRINITY_DN7684_c0_g1_i1.p1  ORF type:complete len:696 (-),score=163.11 TRINITY_DN7684_c0_g1_i1:64-2103(-)
MAAPPAQHQQFSEAARGAAEEAHVLCCAPAPETLSRALAMARRGEYTRELVVLARGASNDSPGEEDYRPLMDGARERACMCLELLPELEAKDLDAVTAEFLTCMDVLVTFPLTADDIGWACHALQGLLRAPLSAALAGAYAVAREVVVWATAEDALTEEHEEKLAEMLRLLFARAYEDEYDSSAEPLHKILREALLAVSDETCSALFEKAFAGDSKYKAALLAAISFNSSDDTRDRALAALTAYNMLEQAPLDNLPAEVISTVLDLLPVVPAAVFLARVAQVAPKQLFELGALEVLTTKTARPTSREVANLLSVVLASLAKLHPHLVLDSVFPDYFRNWLLPTLSPSVCLTLFSATMSPPSVLWLLHGAAFTALNSNQETAELCDLIGRHVSQLEQAYFAGAGTVVAVVAAHTIVFGLVLGAVKACHVPQLCSPAFLRTLAAPLERPGRTPWDALLCNTAGVCVDDVFRHNDLYLAAEVEPERSLPSISRFLQSPKYADATLVVEGKRIPVHLVVLASECAFFDRMMSAGMKEAQEKVIELHDKSYDDVVLLLQCCYGVEITFTGFEHALRILHLACAWDVPQLVKRCSHFLLSRLDSSNVAGLMGLAQQERLFSLLGGCVEWALHGDHWPKFTTQDRAAMSSSIHGWVCARVDQLVERVRKEKGASEAQEPALKRHRR